MASTISAKKFVTRTQNWLVAHTIILFVTPFHKDEVKIVHRLLQCHAKFAKPECRDEPCSCSTVLIFWKLDTGRSTLLTRSMKLVPCLSGEQLERTLQGRLVLCPHRFPFTTYFACCIGCKQRSVLQMEEWDMIINQLLKVVTIFPPIVSSFFYVSMSENCSFKKKDGKVH